MNSTVEIWPAFLKTSAMLCFVLALLVFVFYLVKRFSLARGIKGSENSIKTICVHYLSPKEKLVLLDVLGKKILIGVTPQKITKISSIDSGVESNDSSMETINDSSIPSNKKDKSIGLGFSGMLAKATGFKSASNNDNNAHSSGKDGIGGKNG